MITSTQSKIDGALHEISSQEGLSLRITGHCMAPLINDQDCVQVHAQKSYRTGDILAVRLASGQLVCHRLLGKYFWQRKMHFLTRPDNGKRADGAVTSRMILGKVVTQNDGRPMDSASFFFRLQLFLSFIYYLCLSFFAKIEL